MKRTVYLVTAVALLLLAFLAGRASARPMQTVTYQTAYGPTGARHITLVLPQFDPALGTLLSAELTGTLSDATTYGLVFQCTGMPGTGSLRRVNHSWIDASWPNSNGTVGMGSGGESPEHVGVLNDGGSDHIVSSYQYPLVHPSGPLTGSAMRPFVGTSTIPVMLDLSIYGYYCCGTGCGAGLNYAVSQGNDYTYAMSVTYTYQ